MMSHTEKKKSSLFAWAWRWVEGEMLRIKTEQLSLDGKIGINEIGILLIACIGLMVMQFGGSPEVFKVLWGHQIDALHPYWELYNLLHWIFACLLGYLIIPMIYLKLTAQRLADYYLSPRGFINHFLPYLLLGLPVFLLIIWVSTWPDFQLIYPFYSKAHRSMWDLLVWEIAYILQFFALEFFFRSFLLQGLRKWVGYGAIFIMVVPYCMIHFQKTFAKSFGSIFAGVILGWMAMRSQSIWGGVLLHSMIAVQMDLMSLWRKGLLNLLS
jgi:membrane protease YdiL (CAAX protease family)